MTKEKANDFRNQKFVAGLVATAIKSATSAETDVKIALANCLKMAADSNLGRFNELNELWKGVPNGMRDNIRLWFVNLIEETGISTEMANGRERKVGFFKFSKEKLWHHPETKTDITREHRAIIENMTVDQLVKIPLGPVDRKTVERDTVKSLDQFEAAISRTLKTYFNNGVLSQAQVDRFNSLLSESQRINPEAIQAEKNKRIEAAKKLLREAGELPAGNDNVELPEPVVRTVNA